MPPAATRTRTATAGSTEIRNLERRFKKGYSLVADGKSKFKIVGPDGEFVRQTGSSRPASLPNTPSPSQTKTHEKRLIEWGVIPDPSENGEVREHVADEALRAENVSSRSAVAEQVASVREYLEKSEPWIKKLGGWDARGLTSDLARILVSISDDQRDLGAMSASVSKVKAGDAPGTDNLQLMWKLHDLMMEQEDPREFFFDTIRELRGLAPVKLRKGEEWPFKVELVQLTDCFADDAYQRPVHDLFTRDLVLRFDERLVGTIDVSRRPNGKLAIMDGLQRHTIMTEVGKTACWAAVYSGMTVKEEAEFFYHKNKDRKAIHPYYHFRARLVSGDPATEEINRIVEQRGFKLGVGQYSPEIIVAIKAIEKVYAYSSPFREECLSPSLDLIKRLWSGRKASTDGELIRGLGRFFQVFADWEIQYQHVEEVLAELGPQLVIGRAKDSIINITGGRGGSSGGFGIARTIGEIHNTGLTRDYRLDLKRLSSAPSVRAQALALAELEAQGR